MRKFGYKTWAKIAIFLPIFGFAGFMVWGVFDQWNQNTMLSFICLIVACAFVPPAINIFLRKIVLSDEFIEERNFYWSKRIYYREIIQIGMDNLQFAVSNGRKTITIPIWTVNSTQEIIKTVLLKVDRDNIMWGGDPVEMRQMLDEIAPSNTLTDLKGPSRTGGLFVHGARLAARKWLFRDVELITTEGPLRLIYFGRGNGYECILVNEELVAKDGRNFWYVPQFNFDLKGSKFAVNVEVSSFLSIKKFSIVVDGKTVYQEG